MAKLEKELIIGSLSLAENKKVLEISYKDFIKKLKPNEVVIDLVKFNYYHKKWTDSILYSAFVIKKGFKTPKYIALFEEKQLNKIIEFSENGSNIIDNDININLHSDTDKKDTQK